MVSCLTDTHKKSLFFPTTSKLDNDNEYEKSEGVDEAATCYESVQNITFIFSVSVPDRRFCDSKLVLLHIYICGENVYIYIYNFTENKHRVPHYNHVEIIMYCLQSVFFCK